MMDHTFVVVISERALPDSVESIGKKLMELDGKGIHSGTRSMDVVLSDVLQGIRDKVLLKTRLERHDCEALLRRQLGRDFKLCTMEWIESSI